MTDLAEAPALPEPAAPAAPELPMHVPGQLIAELEKVIVGQRESIVMILSTLLTGGHVLLEDRPGVGKTMLARSLGRVLGTRMGRIQGTPDLLPTDITGVHVFQPNTGEWTFRSGPIFTPLLLVDELNRATPKAQSALLEAMAENQVTVDGSSFKVPGPFMVIATQNPMGEAGTYVLSHAQLDRFAAMVNLGLPGAAAERSILMGTAGRRHLGDVVPVLTEDYLPHLIHAVSNITACDSVIDYVLALVNAARGLEPSVWLSVRVSETVLSVARGHAFMHGRDYVAPEDVQNVLPSVIAHRLPRSIDASAVARLIEATPAPAHATP